MTRNIVFILSILATFCSLNQGRQIFRPVRDERQLFSSSGLVFPGPPRQNQRPQRVSSDSLIPQSTSKNLQIDQSPFQPVAPPAARPAPAAPAAAPVQRNNPAQGSLASRPNQQFGNPHQGLNPVQQRPAAFQNQPFNQERSAPSREEYSQLAERVALPQSQPLPVAAGQAARQNPPAAARPAVPVAYPRVQAENQPDEEDSEDAASEEYYPRSPQLKPQVKPQAQLKPELRKPAIQQQQQQQKRPNYPNEYLVKRPQVNSIDGYKPQEQIDGGEEQELEIEDEEEEAKPDKLTLLLQKTDFDCLEKKDGYYADEKLECEVFHYCQDRIRHSWLCPEGAIFHQVHLICMPITRENICKKSSQFHFVNEYLYKPLDDGRGENRSLIYADRYYPDGYEPGLPFDMDKVDPPSEIQLQPFIRKAPSYSNRPQQYNPIRPNYSQRDHEQQPSEQRSRISVKQQPVAAAHIKDEDLEEEEEEMEKAKADVSADILKSQDSVASRLSASDDEHY